MALEIPHSPTAASVLLTPVEPRYAPLFCMVLLAAGCALASFAFACATPFAAFAVIAAAMLPLGAAVLAMSVAWFVNQAIGFAFLGYPWDVDTVLWGAVIGISALVATAVSTRVLRLWPRVASPVAFGVALIAAYAAYEFVLFAATPVLGGSGDFTVAIVGHLGILSLLWLVGLVAACEVFRLLGAARERRMPS